MSKSVEIVRLAHGGDGLTADGIFIPYTLPGDVVRLGEDEAKGSRNPDILAPGPGRVDPICKHFGRCGGCALQHIEMQAYLAWKRELVVSALAQRGFADVQIEAIRAVGPATRRRAVFKAHVLKAGVALGFYEPESRTLVDIEECPVLVPVLAQSIPRFRTALAKFLNPGDVAELHVTQTSAGLDVSLKWRRTNSVDVLMDLSAFAEEMKLARLHWNGEMVTVAAEPMVRIGKHNVHLPPEAFLQATEEGEAILRGLVEEGVGEAKRIADLFAGCGTFALVLSEGRSVLTAESNAGMVAALDAAARGAGSNVRAERRDLFRRPYLPQELEGLDAVVINPPRPGAKAQAEQLAHAGVAKIVYVSCNPASFARDARVLCDGGYRLTRVVPVDQFLWSPHVELVAELEKDG